MTAMAQASRLSERLRQLRLARGLSQAELAKKLGTWQVTISRWETGTTPHVSTLFRLAKFYEIPVAELTALAEEAGGERGNIRDDDQDRRSG